MFSDLDACSRARWYCPPAPCGAADGGLGVIFISLKEPLVPRHSLCLVHPPCSWLELAVVSAVHRDGVKYIQ